MRIDAAMNKILSQPVPPPGDFSEWYRENGDYVAATISPAGEIQITINEVAQPLVVAPSYSDAVAAVERLALRELIR